MAPRQVVGTTGILLLVLIESPVLIPHGHAARESTPLFDAHIHYNHEVWETVPPKEAIARLRKAGITRALVSSSSDEGTQKLYTEAPDLIIPELRPYRTNGETISWFHDDSVVGYVEALLKQHRYVAIGEFHVSGANADLPIVRRIVQLAKQHGLMLHAHSDAEAIGNLFRQDAGAKIIWAHGGHEKPSVVRAMLSRHANLWVELSSRDDMVLNGRLTEEWRDMLIEFSDRLMIGTDTFTLERWNSIDSNTRFLRAWLAELPAEIAERIAFQNGETILTGGFRVISSSCPKNCPRTTATPTQ